MKKKKRPLAISLILLAIILIIHQALHFSFFGTGISGIYEKGISGFAIGKFSVGGEFKARYQSISPASRIILIAEWAILFILIIAAVIKNRLEIKREISSIEAPDKYRKLRKSTDLDALYNLLKEKKHLRLSTVSKVFKIDKDLALNWSKTLESANLAKINYPKFSDPEVVLEE